MAGVDEGVRGLSADERPDEIVSLPVGLAPLVLASASPRRADLLAAAGLEHSVRPADLDESPRPGEAPLVLCERLAVDKARAAAVGLRAGTVLAGDTVVVRDDVALGKAADAHEARAMLASLAGREHEVASSTALLHVPSGRLVSGVHVSRVRFEALDDARLDAYVAGDEWRGKAGAYAIQGDAGAFARVVEGRVDTVIGLSLALVRDLVHSLARTLEPRS